jgi:sterol desaturase/sphingolipid hydroxylase (fatty acid hydroxylase superfamily)
MAFAQEFLLEQLHSFWKVLPWLAASAIAFGALSYVTPCNPGQHWWKKRGLRTDMAYLFLVPIFQRYLRIWLTVFLTAWLFHITDGQKIADFYLHGHGWLSTLPLWLQGTIYLVGADFAYYWIHRFFHRGMFWKYHAVHHASVDVDWPSAYRWHPVNLMLEQVAVDVAFLLAGVSPDIFLVIGPFNVVTSCMVHANLNWTFGPLRYLVVSPVFHRWHHEANVIDKNFASTFSVWDYLFGTAYMPQGKLPQVYGIDDAAMPEGLVPQLVYPLLQKA